MTQNSAQEPGVGAAATHAVCSPPRAAGRLGGRLVSGFRIGVRGRGLGLVEMLVAMALGVVVTLVASALLVNASANYVHHTESARLTDSGRYALAIVGQAVRQAAMVNWDDTGTPPAVRPEASANIGGLDAASVSRDSDGIESPFPGSVNGSDVLALRFSGSGAAGADGSVLNCAGFGIAAARTEEQRGWSIFYVAVGGDGEAELRCKYKAERSWGSDAIVRGVDSFQVLYGLDTDVPADGIPNRYLSASAIAALDADLVLDGATASAKAQDLNRKTWWKRVASVKVALLLHGEAHTRMDGLPGKYALHGSAYADAMGDRDAGMRIDENLLPAEQRQRVRRLFETSIMLRNPGGV